MGIVERRKVMYDTVKPFLRENPEDKKKYLYLHHIGQKLGTGHTGIQEFWEV